MIMKQLFLRLVMAMCTLVVLAGCASTRDTVTAGDQARFVQPNMRIDKILMPSGVDGTVKEMYMLQAEFKGVDGKPIPFRDQHGNMTTVFRTIETANSLPFVREFILGVSPGAAVAFINGRAARSVAEKGQCADGANCGTVINTQANSVSESLSQNQNTIKVNAGTLPCARTNSCGNLGN